MKTKINKNIILLLGAIIFLLITRANINAQPYYFYRDFISDREVNINKLNLNNSSESIFIEGIYPLTVFKEDGYQKWLITALDGHIKIYGINNSLMVEGFEIDQSSNKDLFVIAIPGQDLLFLSTSESEDEWIYQTNIVNYQNLEWIQTSSLAMIPICFSSSNGDFIYQIVEDSIGNSIIQKYSTELDTIISHTNLSTIFINNEDPNFKFGSLGKALFAYNEIPSEITTKKYIVYDIDNNYLFTPISYPFRSYGYLTPNAQYVIIQKALWSPELSVAENFTGEINIYNPNSGALLKELTLPPDGEILLYDNYPNNIYYAIDIEEPTRQIYTLKMDSIFNVLELTSIAPNTVNINSPGFILTIKGIGFDSVSTVYFNSQEKLTTFISDSVIIAEILASDLNIAGSFPVSVKDRYSISDTLQFSVTQASNPNLVVNLKNSLGNQIPASNVKYYEGSWKDAVNNGDGTFTVITTRPTVSIRVFYEYASQQADNIPAQNNAYTFTTVNAAVQLKNSLGNFIDVGTVQYYSGAWRSFGTTQNGIANKELLPINYSFRMTYEYGSIDKQQDISVDPTVVFQTINAAVQLKNSLGNFIDVGIVQYYAGAWRSFGTTSNGVANKELLPINYSFRMTYEFVSKDKQQNLSTNPVVDFTTVLCTVKVSKTNNNQPINNATVKYYAGAWRNLGTTNADGISTKELLPANLSFRATYGSVSQDKQQDIGTNSLVEIQLNVP